MSPNPPLSRRNFLTIASGTAAASVLAACGGSSSKSTPQTSGSGTGSASASVKPSGSATSSKAAPKLAAAKVDGPTLKIWADASFVPAYIAASKGFTEKYQVNVEFQPLGFNDILTQFQQAGPTGNGPDLIDGTIDWIGPLLKAGLLAPLDYGSKKSSIDTRAATGYTNDGQIYGLPVTIESINVYRNPKLIPDPVTSWDQFRSIAAGLTAKGIRYPLLMESNAYLMIGLITAFGGYCFGKNADGSYNQNDVGLNKPGAIESMAFLDEAVKKKWTRAGVSSDVIAKAFPGGQAGLHVSGPWQLDAYKTAKANFVVDPLPAGPAGPAIPWLASRGWMVNKVGKQADLAKTFLTEYWASDEPMKIMAEQTGKESAWLPVKKATATAQTQRFIAAGAKAQPIPSLPALQAYWPAVGDGMTLIFNQQSTPTKVMNNAQAKVVAAAKSK